MIEILSTGELNNIYEVKKVAAKCVVATIALGEIEKKIRDSDGNNLDQIRDAVLDVIDFLK